MKKKPTIILGSTSEFRKQILEKLNLSFQTAKPEVDETALPNETAHQLVERLAIAKAQAVANAHDNALVIGSDQVALFNDTILGKPHTHENAIKQLSSFSGNKVTFLTGLAVINSDTGETHSLVEPFEVYFKQLTLEDIEAYLIAETPYKCAGSFKSEALGICLFEKLVGDDPNTLVGLPLIKLVGLLEKFGYSVLKNQQAK
ncbi:Maf-like protein [Psychrosphaera saromensis]|uniref:7-methyl-GTP pyrophosphatase n=1 Tax=Psychrosphaera saromensis TaxID=716813 RepID=A0A2S7UWA4_9GAMM|nr:nucleoside triphosphate pyrophosphatase [Psychrosphaera saromensis]PQJ54028.1 septum formation inhibitor Maf [Psychrosphaera saromensis]GHB76292.1 Maf-like protein [Psychrosphaera saromensis]GLQ14475.1 Maf-like protein [Psychrosphaera saromensis]